MKIGILAGSFNPVHIGHLLIANHFAECGLYDKIWFLITPQNPLKNKNDLMSKELRLKLLKKSIQNCNKFEICTIEWDMPSPFYTVNTLLKLRMDYPQNSFELIIGSDNFAFFHSWKDHRTILENFKIFIYPRSDYGVVYFTHPNIFFCENVPKIGISSTFVRESLANGKDISLYIPKLIHKNVINNKFVAIG
ncbi:MAG: nicotinate-nucleotide adenylyltransferase [Bacteroidales bacterium OttesenSCG-928-I14]|jgi:nicotinate-nucleotide adenylyltransferase|nr:nicotinate-nucleotide adenylyltransferase [Bacteroidales bacterium OttesenSCG-928-I14]